MSAFKDRQGIMRLKSLVNELSDRDDQLKKDFQLFEEFFDNFPVPVTMWSITKDKTVISQRGNGFACQKADSLEEMFICPVIKEMSLEKHEIALQGEKVDYFVKTDEKLYFAKLVPRENNNKITGVTGIAWDVTSNAIMLSCIENIYDITLGRRGLYKEIHQTANKALVASRLRKLLDEHGTS
jgi:transcriptional regulator with PAS, ATPase and Fis domain